MRSVPRIALFALFLLVWGNATSQKNIYLSNSFDGLSSDHQVLAILPFFTNLDLGEEVAPQKSAGLNNRRATLYRMPWRPISAGVKRKKSLP